MSDYTKSVIENRGQECSNCGEWRILTTNDCGSLSLILDCSECGDEAFDIYEVEDDGP